MVRRCINTGYFYLFYLQTFVFNLSQSTQSHLTMFFKNVTFFSLLVVFLIAAFGQTQAGVVRMFYPTYLSYESN